jgi:hypothetical protein
MPRAGFEPAIPMFERPKTVLALELVIINAWNNKYEAYIQLVTVIYNCFVSIGLLLRGDMNSPVDLYSINMLHTLPVAPRKYIQLVSPCPTSEYESRPSYPFFAHMKTGTLLHGISSRTPWLEDFHQRCSLPLSTWDVSGEVYKTIWELQNHLKLLERNQWTTKQLPVNSTRTFRFGFAFSGNLTCEWTDRGTMPLIGNLASPSCRDHA